MTFYQRITAMNEPQDMGVDFAGRPTFSFDMLVTKRPSSTVEKEFYGLISGLLPSGQVIATSKATIPDGDGPILTIRVMGGAGAIFSHDSTNPIRRPSVRITSRAVTSQLAEDTAHAAYNVLVAVTNRDVIPAVL